MDFSIFVVILFRKRYCWLTYKGGHELANQVINYMGMKARQVLTAGRSQEKAWMSSSSPKINIRDRRTRRPKRLRCPRGDPPGVILSGPDPG